MPIYIKPHGTISRPATLRYTRKAYYQIPTSILDLMGNLMQQRDLDLVLVGFSMKSPEIIKILKDHKYKIRIFNIARSAPKQISTQLPKIPVYNIPVTVKRTTASVVFSSIWTKVEKCFESEYKPRNISRHIIVSKIFIKGEIAWGERRYFLDRTLIEICIAAARGRGFVSLPCLLDDRAGFYFSLYRDEEKRRRKSPSKIPTLLDFCERLGLQDIGYAGESLVFWPGERDSLLVPKVHAQAFILQLIGKLNEKESGASPALQGYCTPSRNNYQNLVEFLLEQYRGGESEIRLDPPQMHPGYYREVVRIQTKTAFQFYTQRMIRKRGWRHLLVVSEGGQWLADDRVVAAVKKIKTRRVKLIVADNSYRPVLTKEYGKQIEIVTLDWWSHNRHMTLIESADKTPDECIYFNRKDRTPNLRPIYIQNQDLKSVRNVFVAYWLKAKFGGNSGITPEMIDDFDDF